MKHAIALIALLAAACRPALAPSPTQATWLIVAPHPDDETLIASGVIASAVQRGERVEVVVVTNGDYDCVASGWIRQRESIDGMARLGLPESAVHFLGYPDGALPNLGKTPLATRRVDANGTCALGERTYGLRGAPSSRGHGFTHENMVADLAAAIAALRPTDIAVTHPMDTHPDHATAYALVRNALDRVELARGPRIHRALVHNDDCWPIGTALHEPCAVPVLATDEPMPPLTNRLAGYIPRERREVPVAMQVASRDTNPKLLAIAAHGTQTRGSPESYLFGFARKDEPFYPEDLEARGGRWVRIGRAGPSRRRRLRRSGGRLSVPEAAAYEVVVDGAKREAACEKNGKVLQVWPLPFDLWSDGDGEEAFEIEVDARPEDGAVVEISLRCRGELVGVAVDPHATR